MPPVSSPTRRVLGEKDANASLNTTSPRKSLKANVDSRPHVSPRRKGRVLSEAIVAVSMSPKIGQKRRITEVEGVESQDWDERIRASQATDIISDSASEIDQAETSMLSTRSAADTTLTSFGIGLSQEDQVEQEFHLPEPEMSQKTLDKFHAITLPQNTSQPSQLRPTFEQQQSLDSVAMSRFVDFHSDQSSQGSDGIRLLDNSAPVQPESNMRETRQAEDREPTEEERRRLMMQEKAAQLRTRLQLAFFKVETRQTNTPLSRLKVPESHRRIHPSPPSLLPLLHASNQHRRTPTSGIPHARTGLSPEARIAALRAQAAMQIKPAVPTLSSLPFPTIKPTAFSARWPDRPSSSHPHSHPHLDQQPPPVHSSDDQTIELPSSPPLSNRSLHIHEDETATAARMRTPSSIEVDDRNSTLLPKTSAVSQSTNEQLSSPPPSHNGDNDSLHALPSNERVEDMEERGSMSSNPKSEAASGLLELMRSGGSESREVRGPHCGF